MNYKAFIQLLRPLNLLMICYVQFLVHFVLFKSLAITSLLPTSDFLLICVATVLIAAAGNVINDVKDVTADAINRPDQTIIGTSIEKDDAIRLYRVLNALGLSAGVIISFRVGKPEMFFFFLIPALLLYLYAIKIKAIPFLGNFIIALLVGFAVLLPGFFELEKEVIGYDELEAWTVLLLLTLFAVLLNVSREIIKDIIDIKGDYKQGKKSLPIVLGINRSRKIAVTILFLVLILLLSIIFIIVEQNRCISLYLVAAVLLPLLVLSIKILNRGVNESFNSFSMGLKIIMLLGMSSLLCYLNFM